MSIDKNNPGSTADDQTDGTIESLESAEIEGADLETISGGMGDPYTSLPFNCATHACKKA
jgi:hypothetical protein